MEIQRYANIVPNGVNHCSSKDMAVNGMTIPASTLFMPLMAELLKGSYWGDGEVFKPERFLGPSIGSCIVRRTNTSSHFRLASVSVSGKRWRKRRSSFSSPGWSGGSRSNRRLRERIITMGLQSSQNPSSCNCTAEHRWSRKKCPKKCLEKVCSKKMFY